MQRSAQRFPETSLRSAFSAPLRAGTFGVHGEPPKTVSRFGTCVLGLTLQTMGPMSEARIGPKAMEICILAGGLSSRMGRDKARMRLGGKSLLSHIKAAAAGLASRVRIIRKDLVPRCGPLGGIYTALRTTQARRVLFLSCDTPFVPRSLLERLLLVERPTSQGRFVFHRGAAGFPFVIRVEALPQVQAQLADQRFSLQELARRLKATLIRPDPGEGELLLNVNTPEDWVAARRLWKERRSDCSAGTRAARPRSC